VFIDMCHFEALELFSLPLPRSKLLFAPIGLELSRDSAIFKLGDAPLYT
jgi:hypothetical protein